MSEKCNEHSGCKTDIANLKDSDKLQWEAINKIQNRLPVWATLLLTVMGGVVGWALAFSASLMQKLSS